MKQFKKNLFLHSYVRNLKKKALNVEPYYLEKNPFESFLKTIF